MKIRLLILSLLASSWAFADDIRQLSPTVVTATRVETNSFDLPVSIDVTDKENISDAQLKVNISESSARVPGVVVNNRNNPAQDLAIQIRGFGARSAFGVRGVRLYADGIPMTMPDGQGQTGTFNLDTAARIEYLKGPFSALYGNSSGGVVQIFTEDGPKDQTLKGDFSYGSFNSFRESITYGGSLGNVNYNFNTSTYKTDGYRDYSNMRRDSLHGKVRFDINDSTKLTFVTTFLDQPDNKDPGGISQSVMDAGYKSANSNSTLYSTRVTKRQQQIGATLEHTFSDYNSISLMAYYGHRDNIQYASTTITNQKNDWSPGGVSAIERDFGGTDIHWTHKGNLINSPYQVTTGINYDRMYDDRKGWENFTSSNSTYAALGGLNTASTNSVTLACGANFTCGVKGNLRRDERNIAFNFDKYIQGSIDVNDKVSFNAGIRSTKVNFKNEDKYTADPGYDNSNGDDSGALSFKKTTPVIGALFKASKNINLYANMGTSFETPTFTEMSYKSSGSGLNLDLKPAISSQYEFGVKSFIGNSTLINASVYKISTDDEIILEQQANGRSIYQNAKKSERKGFEVSVDSEISKNIKGYLAYTFLDAEFNSSFYACKPFGYYTNSLGVTSTSLQTKCVSNTASSTDSGKELIASGAEIPGVYKHTFYGELMWRDELIGLTTAIEGRVFSKTNVAFKDEYGKADGYAIASWRASLVQNISSLKIKEFVRVDNLFDKNYVGSIRVADLNSNYFEPAPGRSWLVGINASYQFK